MIRHIVLFKMKPFASESSRMQKLNEIRDGLLALKPIVKELRREDVGINVNSSESWDLSLVCEFDNMADLEVYANHPDHVKVKKIIGEVVESRACVDSEFRSQTSRSKQLKSAIDSTFKRFAFYRKNRKSIPFVG